LAALLWAGVTGCEQAADSAPSAPEIGELVVLTPHDPAIQEAFNQKFSLWYEKQHGDIVTIRWIRKGTLECYRYIVDRFAQYPEAGSRQIGVDVFFGGGLAVHRDVAEHGYAQAIKLPESVLEGIPKELNGQPLYAEDGTWFGAALGGLGIFYNRDACDIRGVPEPTTWSDLASPAYAGWVAAADPATSGSTAQCLVLALLKHGWDDGWGVVTGMLANCNGLSPSSSYIGPDVVRGKAVAGLEPEFVAQRMIASSPDGLGYVNPPEATAISPDPVTVLAGAQNLDAATHFVEFVISPEGQALWALSPDHPDGPPSGPLYRYPVRPELYEKYGDEMVVKGNPFETSSVFQIDPEVEAAYTKLLPALLSAACGRRNHLLLQQAWRPAAAQGNATILNALKQPPFDRSAAMRFAEEISRNPLRASELEKEWTEMFRTRYEQAIGGAATTG
jgi:ABC-type Fe3+ transport system substrate-binding protein